MTYQWPDVRAMITALSAANGRQVIFKEMSAGRRRTWDWDYLVTAVNEIGAAAIAEGLAPGDAGCILAQTRADWLAADLGLQCVGLTSAGIYPTEPPGKIAYIVNDCAARIVFVDGKDQLDKLLAVLDICPSVQRIILFDEADAPPDNPMVVSMSAWREAGRNAVSREPSIHDGHHARLATTTTAMLVYTSGTTGAPKGAMITHGNLVCQVAGLRHALRLETGWERPAFLPLCHIAERSATYVAMASGVISVFVEAAAALGAALPHIRPQFMLGVPRIFEKLKLAGEGVISRSPASQRDALTAAISEAEAATRKAVAGDRLSADEEALLARLQAGPLRQLREVLGLDRARCLLSGGARFPIEIHIWMQAIGAPVRDIYGMTECGTVTLSRDAVRASGLVGTPLPHAEIKIDPTGEILVRGPHVFAGYLNLPEKTAETLRDGWLHTGDAGHLDPEGRLVIADRLKDIIITSSGKNIAPAGVEAALRTSPYISDAVVVGDGRHYLTAIILPDIDALAAALNAAGHDAADISNAAAHDLIAQAVADANSQMSRIEGIKKFRILPRVFGPDDEEVTATLKIKRNVVLQKYAGMIDEMYDDAVL